MANLSTFQDLWTRRFLQNTSWSSCWGPRVDNAQEVQRNKTRHRCHRVSEWHSNAGQFRFDGVEIRRGIGDRCCHLVTVTLLTFLFSYKLQTLVKWCTGRRYVSGVGLGSWKRAIRVNYRDAFFMFASGRPGKNQGEEREGKRERKTRKKRRRIYKNSASQQRIVSMWLGKEERRGRLWWRSTLGINLQLIFHRTTKHEDHLRGLWFDKMRRRCLRWPRKQLEATEFRNCLPSIQWFQQSLIQQRKKEKEREREKENYAQRESFHTK